MDISKKNKRGHFGSAEDRISEVGGERPPLPDFPLSYKPDAGLTYYSVFFYIGMVRRKNFKDFSVF